MRNRILIGALAIGIAAAVFSPRTTEAQGVVTFVTVADITGSAATVQLSSTSTTIRACQFVAPAGNGAVVRWGDSNTSISRGAIIAAGGGQMTPPLPGKDDTNHQYNMTNIYFYIANGDKITATCVK